MWEKEGHAWFAGNLILKYERTKDLLLLPVHANLCNKP